MVLNVDILNFLFSECPERPTTFITSHLSKCCVSTEFSFLSRHLQVTIHQPDLASIVKKATTDSRMCRTPLDQIWSFYQVWNN